MNKETYSLLEGFMLSCMKDSAHDREHIYRVLYNALEIAKGEVGVDYDVLICSCLLHDVGRKEQFEDPSLCHAEVGGEKSYRFLIEHGFGQVFAHKVKHCIKAHRYRTNNLPESIEAKILFDADKLDVAGAIGIARSLVYKGEVAGTLYTVTAEGKVSSGENDTEPSFFGEYKFKLEKLYTHFYTARGKELALGRQHAAVAFYNSLYSEVSSSYQLGKAEMAKLIKQ